MKLLFILIAITSAAVQCTIVKIPNGELLGSYNGKYYSFLNVPYAEAPIGRNRFEAPIPYTTKWKSVRNATVPSDSCVQVSALGIPTRGVEDCLIVNVFTPSINCKRLRPVHVYIHGGTFIIGTARDTDESRMVAKDNVLVVPNYRLGPFGFLSSGDELISGNFGLKDQQLALQWVYENIHAFCGDNKKIVLSGFSAGGASVSYQMLNWKSAQYFNAAMSRSGVAIDPWALQPQPKKQLEKFVAALRCQAKKPQAVKACLQSRTKEEIANATLSLRLFRGNPVNPFGVVIESKTVPNPFITADPRTLIKSGRVPRIPWIVSYAHRDGSYTAAEFRSFAENGRELIEILNTDWLRIAPITLGYQENCAGCSEEKAARVRNARSNELRRKYMQGRNFSVETYPLLEQMFTDVMFADGAREMVDLYRKHVGSPVYLYDFRNPLKNSIGNVISNRSDIEFGESSCI